MTLTDPQLILIVRTLHQLALFKKKKKENLFFNTLYSPFWEIWAALPTAAGSFRVSIMHQTLDMDYRFFNLRTWSFLCRSTHVSQCFLFLLNKQYSHQFGDQLGCVSQVLLLILWACMQSTWSFLCMRIHTSMLSISSACTRGLQSSLWTGNRPQHSPDLRRLPHADLVPVGQCGWWAWPAAPQKQLWKKDLHKSSELRSLRELRVGEWGWDGGTIWGRPIHDDCWADTE